MRLKHYIRKYLLLPLVATCALAAFALPTSAQAEYNGYYYLGCTYSWGAGCLAPYQHIEDNLAMDPDHAYEYIPGNVKVSNGYPKPHKDNIERDVCSSVYANSHELAYGWTCGWGAAIIYPHIWGYPGLGTAVEYYNIALYEYTNY